MFKHGKINRAVLAAEVCWVKSCCLRMESSDGEVEIRWKKHAQRFGFPSQREEATRFPSSLSNVWPRSQSSLLTSPPHRHRRKSYIFLFNALSILLSALDRLPWSWVCPGPRRSLTAMPPLCALPLPFPSLFLPGGGGVRDSLLGGST